MTQPPAPAPPSVATADGLRAGKPPVGTGSSPLFAQLVALALVVLGVVGVQHLLVLLDAVGGPSWLTSAVETLDGIQGDSPLVLVVGVVGVLLGLLLLPVALKRRPRRGVALTAHTGVDLRTRDLARVVKAAVVDTESVTAVDVRARRRRVRVVATSVAAVDRGDDLRATLRSRVDSVLAAVERTPKVSVTVRHESA